MSCRVFSSAGALACVYQSIHYIAEGDLEDAAFHLNCLHARVCRLAQHVMEIHAESCKSACSDSQKQLHACFLVRRCVQEMSNGTVVISNKLRRRMHETIRSAFTFESFHSSDQSFELPGDPDKMREVVMAACDGRAADLQRLFSTHKIGAEHFLYEAENKTDRCEQNWSNATEGVPLAVIQGNAYYWERSFLFKVCAYFLTRKDLNESHFEVLRVIIRNGGSVDSEIITSDEDQDPTLLHALCDILNRLEVPAGNVEKILRFLIAEGADPTQLRSLVMDRSSDRNREMVATLLDSGYNPQHENLVDSTFSFYFNGARIGIYLGQVDALSREDVLMPFTARSHDGVEERRMTLRRINWSITLRRTEHPNIVRLIAATRKAVFTQFNGQEADDDEADTKKSDALKINAQVFKPIDAAKVFKDPNACADLVMAYLPDANLATAQHCYALETAFEASGQEYPSLFPD